MSGREHSAAWVDESMPQERLWVLEARWSPEEGVPLAMAEGTGAALWPRFAYPSAEDALVAQDALDRDGWAFTEGYRVRLVWATPAPEVEPGWWTWDSRPERQGLECWEVGP